jgi:MFS-type transporter involved in bile tolerance (Atg22 family)
MMVRILKGIGAVLGGFMAVALLSVGIDTVLETAGILPRPDKGLWDTQLLILVLAYRSLITVGGGWLTARWAPYAPLRHALVLAVIGFVVALLGVMMNRRFHMGPDWYPIALAVEAIPLVMLGAWLRVRGRA